MSGHNRYFCKSRFKIEHIVGLADSQTQTQLCNWQLALQYILHLNKEWNIKPTVHS